MRIVDIRELSMPISRYADPSIPSGGLTTSMVAVVTDAVTNGKPTVGYGFASIGRFAQGGLILERFAPRLLAARDIDVMDEAGTNLDPFRAWNVMMTGEKPGGHGERCVAVGALDMAIWDAAAKIAHLPLYRLLADRTAGRESPNPTVSVYAGGGYYYPSDDIALLTDEIRRDAFAATIAEDEHVALVVDGAGWHGSKTLNVPSNITHARCGINGGPAPSRGPDIEARIGAWIAHVAHADTFWLRQALLEDGWFEPTPGLRG